jgi:hypothetical protein
VGENLDNLRDILYRDLDIFEHDLLKLQCIFLIILTKTFVRPGSSGQEGLLSLKTKDMTLTVNVFGEFILTINFIGKCECLTSKTIVFSNKSLYEQLTLFISLNREYFFGEIRYTDVLTHLNTILPGATMFQIRHSCASLLFFEFMRIIEQGLVDMKENNLEKFDIIKNLLVSHPLVVFTKASRHISYVLDHMFVGTTICYIDVILLYWFIAQFHSNRETIKSILLRLLDEEATSNLIDDTENSIGLGEEFEFEKMETTKLEDMVYQNSVPFLKFIYGNNSREYAHDVAFRHNSDGINFFTKNTHRQLSIATI